MLTFPDEMTVATPRFSFDVPQGWEVTHVDHVLFCLIRQREDSFSPNLVVSHDRRVASITSEEIMAEMDAYVGSLQNVKVTARKGGKDRNGQEWDVMEYVYDHQVGQLACCLAVLTSWHDGVADSYQFQASAAGPSAADDLKDVHQVITSVRLLED